MSGDGKLEGSAQQQAMANQIMKTAQNDGDMLAAEGPAAVMARLGKSHKTGTELMEMYKVERQRCSELEECLQRAGLPVPGRSDVKLADGTTLSSDADVVGVIGRAGPHISIVCLCLRSRVAV